MSDPQTSAAVGPSPRTRLRRARTPLVIAALAVLVSLALAALSAQPRTGRLDPRATDPAGSRAVAQVLEAQGVEVVLVRAADAAAAELARGSATLLVADDTLLGDSALSEEALAPLAGAAADVVLVAPSQATLEELVPEVRRSGADSGPADAPRDPACTDPDAAAAGRATVAGQGYQVTPSTGEPVEIASCYPRAGSASLVIVVRRSGAAETTSGRVAVLGDGTPLTNERVGEEGNAALALRLLGRNDRLVWLLPDGRDLPGAGERSLISLLPDGIRWGAVQLLVAMLVLALVQARRLGRVVPEALPVVVRAAETTEGRARLYRRVRARGTAASVLRHAAVERLAARLGLPPGPERATVVTAVARRSGWPDHQVATLLYGPAPTKDPALVALADDLDRLEREVTPT